MDDSRAAGIRHPHYTTGECVHLGDVVTYDRAALGWDGPPRSPHIVERVVCEVRWNDLDNEHDIFVSTVPGSPMLMSATVFQPEMLTFVGRAL